MPESSSHNRAHLVRRRYGIHPPWLNGISTRITVMICATWLSTMFSNRHRATWPHIIYHARASPAPEPIPHHRSDHHLTLGTSARWFSCSHMAIVSQLYFSRSTLHSSRSQGNNPLMWLHWVSRVVAKGDICYRRSPFRQFAIVLLLSQRSLQIASAVVDPWMLMSRPKSATEGT